MLILLRHGESQANEAGLLTGRVDSPLTTLGVTQAKALGRHLAQLQISVGRIVASPLRRARDTAEIVAAELGRQFGTGGGEVVIEPALVEMDYGSFDGRRLSELGPQIRERWRSDPAFHPDGGESLMQVQERVSAWCDEMARGMGQSSDSAATDSQHVLAISHVSPIKAAAIWALDGDPLLAWRLSLGLATITRVALRPKAVVTFGETGHLQ